MRTLIAVLLALLLGSVAQAEEPSKDFMNSVVACEWCSKHPVKAYAEKGFNKQTKISWEKVEDHIWIMVATVYDPLTKSSSAIRIAFAKSGDQAVIGGVMLDGERAAPRIAAGVQEGIAANIDKSK